MALLHVARHDAQLVLLWGAEAPSRRDNGDRSRLDTSSNNGLVAAGDGKPSR
jgi:hypothetical protein